MSATAGADSGCRPERDATACSTSSGASSRDSGAGEPPPLPLLPGHVYSALGSQFDPRELCVKYLNGSLARPDAAALELQELSAGPV